jgi:D-alanine-D-alanine ligase
VKINDAREFGRVAVVMGGESAEREVSLDSGRNVLAALRARGVDAHAVDGIPALLDALRAGHYARVFNILHGQHGGGEDGVLQGALDSLHVPYTGSGVLGSALSMDKVRTKQVWIAQGLPTPRFVALRKGRTHLHAAAALAPFRPADTFPHFAGEGTAGRSVAGGGRNSNGVDVHAAAAKIGLPVIVKPACEGSSVGVTRVHREEDLAAAAELAARYPGDLLVEELIEGDELTVAVLGREALPSIRIVPKGAFYDYHAKYVAEDTQYLCPGLDGAAEAELRALALAAFDAVGCAGWGRVDVMRDHEGRNFLLEVNTAPGMTSHSLVPKAAGTVGIDFETLCWRVLETSFDREMEAGNREPVAGNARAGSSGYRLPATGSRDPGRSTP